MESSTITIVRIKWVIEAPLARFYSVAVTQLQEATAVMPSYSPSNDTEITSAVLAALADARYRKKCQETIVAAGRTGSIVAPLRQQRFSILEHERVNFDIRCCYGRQGVVKKGTRQLAIAVFTRIDCQLTA